MRPFARARFSARAPPRRALRASGHRARAHPHSTTRAMKNDELKRHATYLLAWCGVIRASTYVVQALFGAESA
jgi:hypothetical protein